MQYSQFDRVLAILCSVLDAHSVCLFLPAENVGVISPEHYMAASFSLSSQLDHDAMISEGRGLAGWILRHKEPLLVSNFDQRRNHLGYYQGNEEQNIKAFMGCALEGGMGVLCADSKRQYSFTEKDQKMMHLFADLLRQLQLDQAGEEERRATLKYFSALKAVHALRYNYSRWGEFLRAFLDLIVTVTGFSYAALCTLDPNGEGYSVEGENPVMVAGRDASESTSFPLHSGLVGWVFRHGKPVISDGGEGMADAMLFGREVQPSHFQTIIAVPLIFQRKVRGVLCLGHGIPVEVQEPTKDFVRMASDYLALFFESLYFKSRFRELQESR